MLRRPGPVIDDRHYVRWCWCFRTAIKYDVLPFFWVPQAGARQRERLDRVPYGQWIREGFIDACPGEVIDYDRIRSRINDLQREYSIRQIAIDRWNATQLATQLDADGFEMVSFGQGYASMSAPTKKLEELVLAGRLRHGANPVLRWMAGEYFDRAGRGRQLEAVEEEKS